MARQPPAGLALAVLEAALWVAIFIAMGLIGKKIQRFSQSSNKLNNAASLLDLTLGLLGEIARAHDDRDLREATLAQDLGVAER